MYLRIPPLRIKITLESKPLKSTMLVGRLAVGRCRARLEAEAGPAGTRKRSRRFLFSVRASLYIYIYIYMYMYTHMIILLIIMYITLYYTTLYYNYYIIWYCMVLHRIVLSSRERQSSITLYTTVGFWYEEITRPAKD